MNVKLNIGYVCCAIAVVGLSSLCAGAPSKLVDLDVAIKAVGHLRPDSGGRGSAFCFDSSGLFLSNYHVVRDSETVIIALNSGLPDEREVFARVLRKSKDMDLALLKTIAPGPYTALSFNTNAIESQSRITALGFPYPPGTRPSGENPPVTMSRGKAVALHTEGDGQSKLEVDMILFSGNSGGPILDGRGQVVGVVLEGRPGKHLSFAIPVKRVLEFLAKPVVLFEPPFIYETNKDKPALFSCDLLVLDGRDPKDFAISLALSGPAPLRILPLARISSKKFQVTVVPVPEEVRGHVGSISYCFNVEYKGQKISSERGMLAFINLNRGLVLRLPFAKGFDMMAANRFGQNNNVRFVGNPRWMPEEKRGVIELDGKDDMIDILVNPGRQQNTDMSLAVLLRIPQKTPVVSPEKLEAVEQRTPDAVAIPRRHKFASSIPCWPSSWGSVYIPIIGGRQYWMPKVIDDGRWHLVVLTRDVQAGNRAAMYVDGDLTLNGTFSEENNAQSGIQFGLISRPGRPDTFLHAQIDEIRIYERVLRELEIKAMTSLVHKNKHFQLND